MIRKLGKISGKLFDKDRYLNSYNLLNSWKDYNVLKDTCALIELEKKSVVNNHGDHAIFFFDVTSF